MVISDFGGRVLGRSELVDIRPKFSSLCYHLLSALRSDNNNNNNNNNNKKNNNII